jgi:hypothetical protein
VEAERGPERVKARERWSEVKSGRGRPKVHASEIWACDFVQTYDLFFRTVYVYFIVELGSRKVVHYGVTRSPSDVWVAQQIREATPYAERPRFLIRDNDKKYGRCFARVTEGSQIEVLKTPSQFDL